MPNDGTSGDGAEPSCSFAVISRKWNQPAISVCYEREGIKIRMPLTDFVKSLHAQTRSARGPIGRFLLGLVLKESHLLSSQSVIEEEMKSATAGKPPPIGW